jgi:hypothetical protein
MIRKLFLMMLLVCTNAFSAITDGKFGINQIFDVQYWWNGNTLNASNFIAPYNKDFQTVTTTAGQYFQFFNSTTNPGTYGLKLMNSNGTQHSIVHDTGDITALGSGAIFYIGSGFFGNVITTAQGYNYGASAQFTNMDTDVTSSDLNNYSFASSTPLAAGETAGSSSPTVTGTSTTNSVSTSSSSSNTSSITVTRPTTTGNFNDVFVGTTTVTTTTTTPVTTTTYSDGSTTTSNGTPSSTTNTTYTITPTYGTAPVYSRSAPNIGGNSIYIKQVTAGTNNSVTLEQDGNNNAITGTDSGWATLNGNGNILSIKQFGQGNITGVKMNAWGNNIDIKQQAANGGDVNNNIFNFESAGNGNTVTAQQQSNNNTASVKTTWDINTVNITQRTGTGNASYATLTGYWNTVNNTQSGSNNLSIVNVSGDNNSATVNQTGTGHSTLLNLIGNKNTVSVTQTGVGDAYTLQQTCTNPAGCSVSVIRNR